MVVFGPTTITKAEGRIYAIRPSERAYIGFTSLSRSWLLLNCRGRAVFC